MGADIIGQGLALNLVLKLGQSCIKRCLVIDFPLQIVARCELSLFLDWALAQAALGCDRLEQQLRLTSRNSEIPDLDIAW